MAERSAWTERVLVQFQPPDLFLLKGEIVDENRDIETEGFQVNPGYALGQIARALTTSVEHEDAKTRELARKKISKWLQIFEGVINGTVHAGSRTPLVGVPEWATLEVVQGGFATGELLANGKILDHELALLKDLSISARGNERQALNSYFVTEDGVSRLREALSSGQYEIDVPEEGALLVVAWLLDNDHANMARELLDEIGPFFEKLRFYPAPAERPRRLGSRVYLQDVATTIRNLNNITPNRQILAQKEAIEVWTPLYDQTVDLFLETVEGEPPYLVANGKLSAKVEGGRPCTSYPQGWKARAQGLLDEYAVKRQVHTLCEKPDRKKENFPQLRWWLQRCIDAPGSLSNSNISRIRLLVARYVSRRGMPQSPQCQEVRKRQAMQAGGPTHQEISKVVVSRLKQQPRNSGIEELNSIVEPVSQEESEKFQIAAAASIPESILHKVRRCLIDTTDELIKKGVITSGETLARVLPQITSGLRAAGITDPILRQLYSSIYRAFRRRRSLLLLNLESQVKIEELPWIAAIDKFRRDDLSTRELAKETLQEITALTVVSFPHVIIPNKLLQELRALAKGANLDLPLVDEVAADIFMGEFSPKFVQAAKRAAGVLEGTLYETYYGIDYKAVRKLPEPKRRQQRSWYQRSTGGDKFVKLCSARAGVSYGGWDVATNGMIIEQQQILTTQNLAVLFDGLELTDELRGHMISLAKQCFEWICNRQQANSPTWHALLIMLKNTAYAWRQMVFYLALLPNACIEEFLAWADSHLSKQQIDFQNRFRPALTGLQFAADGRVIDDAHRFLGWTKERHWLLGPKPG